MEWLTVMGISVITGIVVAAIATVAALRWDSRQQLAELNEEYRQLVEEMQ